MSAHIKSNWCIAGTAMARRPEFGFGWPGNALVQVDLHHHIRLFVPDVNSKFSISTQKQGSYIFSHCLSTLNKGELWL
jgi:hypothetical protein